ncbi:MAG: hypothetical protein JWQ89_2251 [Devosia sp.]|uniref:GTA-gp10 family protein n=1 Tax=Devosia sp. TaxID=1871048 RepID=UPI00260DFFBD|nr:hypothetical protein [Devosia sp.]MDB5540524.1 hypothetical protein [Devosia sp.]
MANPIRGEVDITVGGKTYTIKLGRNALASVEGLLGRGFPEIAQSLTSDPQIVVMRAILWAGLQRYHPELDLMQVGDLMDEAGDDLIGEKIGEALRITFPQADTTARPQKPGRKAGTKT